ncbi:MAG: polyprenol monophosphomannose synthase [Ilumatobacteraceae bacterium]
MRALVVLPTFNEAENIAGFLRAVRQAAPDADVLVVDDNSPDGTAALAEETAAELGRIKVLHRAGKLGLGAAYRHGFTTAFDENYDVIVSMDSDYSHDPTVIPTMFRLLTDGADAVIGSRYVPGGDTVDWPLRRKLLSKWGNRYTAAILRLPIRDCTSGFRAYRAEALRTIDPASTRAEGYAFLTELVRKLIANGATIVETPIVFRDRRFGTSKMSGRIIAESMLLVTKWGLVDRMRRQPTR